MQAGFAVTGKADGDGSARTAAREERRAAAMRENLKRRKAQRRARDDGVPGAPDVAGGSEGPDGADQPPDEPGPASGALRLWIPEALPMTVGKAMAQAGHAGMICAALRPSFTVSSIQLRTSPRSGSSRPSQRSAASALVTTAASG